MRRRPKHSGRPEQMAARCAEPRPLDDGSSRFPRVGLLEVLRLPISLAPKSVLAAGESADAGS
jgi:hypothetical protein